MRQRPIGVGHVGLGKKGREAKGSEVKGIPLYPIVHSLIRRRYK